MLRRPLSTLLLCALLPLGCKDEAETKETTAEGGEAKAEAEDGDVKAEGGDAKADGGDAKADGGDAKADGGEAKSDSAAGGAVGVSPDAVTECPESLKGKDTVDRVIKKECGVVPVTGNYSVEGATLVLEAGATLAFAEGSKMTVGYYEPAKLMVAGTSTDPVTFTTSGDKAPGVWEGVFLHEKAARSSIEGLVIEYAGKKKAALHIEAEDVTLAGSTVRNAKEHAIEIAREGSVTMVGSTVQDVGPVAMRVTPEGAGGVAAGNTFPADSRVQVMAGRIDEDTTWNAIGTAWLLTGRVQVHGEAGQRAVLTLQPGAELRLDGDGTIDVGYYEQGGLTAEGSADAPIVFAAHERQEPGGWGGLRIYGKGEARIAHARFVNGGRKDNEGTLLIDDAARVSLADSTFEANAVGVVVRGKKAELEAFDRVTFKATPIALRGAARVLGALGGANVYEGEPAIVAESDKLEADATWKHQVGAKVQLDGRLQVSGGRLTLEPGITVHVKDGGEVQVGYYDIGGIEMKGTEDAPVSFVGQRDEPGAWNGVILYGKAKGNVLDNVVLRNVGGQAGVRLDGEADAKITNLRCDACSTPTLKWTCKGTVEHTGVEAGEGTPSALEAPSCK